jgi:tetratricopeptide (TPR) repeat protein
MDRDELHARMHGNFASKKEPSKKNVEKDRFEIAFEKEIDSYVDAMELEDDPDRKEFLSPKLRREKIKTELKAAAKMEELSKLLETAVTLLISEGADYLPAETYQQLTTDLSNAYTQIENINLDNPTEIDIPSAVQLSNESLLAIATIATKKFSQESYFDCLSLFSLLSVLHPEHPEYWFRLGIAAQKIGNLELASRAYAATSELDAKHIGARLFAAECYLQRDLKNEAKAEFEAAKEIARDNEIEKMWLDLLPQIESMIKS